MLIEKRFDWSKPYRWRADFRAYLPWFIGRHISKGEDCESVGSEHQWYNSDNIHSACYHCEVFEKGQLWQQ